MSLRLLWHVYERKQMKIHQSERVNQSKEVHIIILSMCYEIYILDQKLVPALTWTPPDWPPQSSNLTFDWKTQRMNVSRAMNITAGDWLLI
jgi:hypothetical protein